MAPIEAHAWDEADALLSLVAPENTRELSRLPADRLALLQGASREHYERVFTHELKWVGCQFPTPALAQEAEMSLEEFSDFLFGACLLDWDAERERMKGYAELFDEAEVVRIVAGDTDLSLGIDGRSAAVDAGGANMPGGEFYCSPLEDSAEGVIAFSEFPTEQNGQIVEGIRLVFRAGAVADASARRGEDVLLEALETDDGARRIGEVGIGCNEGITRHLNNTLFDEKMAGTVHIALGAGYSFAGGVNVSALHWDIVKDLRAGGRIYCDDELVQEDGRWLV
jgi:aminopeptidase